MFANQIYRNRLLVVIRNGLRAKRRLYDIRSHKKYTRYAQNFLHCKYERTASGGKSGSSPDDASVISRVAKAFCGFDSSIEEAMLTKEVSIICLRVDTESLFVIANEDDDIEPLWRRLFNDIVVRDDGWNANIPPDNKRVSIAMFFMVENIK